MKVLESLLRISMKQVMLILHVLSLMLDLSQRLTAPATKYASQAA